MNSKTHKHTMRLMHDGQPREGCSHAFKKINWKRENTNMNSKTHKHTMGLMHDGQPREGCSHAFTKPNWKKEKKIQVHKCKFRHHIKILLQSKGWPRMASQVGSEVNLYWLHLSSRLVALVESLQISFQIEFTSFTFSVVSAVWRFPFIS